MILYIRDSYQIDERNIFKLSEIVWVCKYVGRCRKQNWGCWNMVQSLKQKHWFMSFLCISKPHVLFPLTVEKPWIMCQKSRQSLALKMKIVRLMRHGRAEIKLVLWFFASPFLVITVNSFLDDHINVEHKTKKQTFNF